MDFFDAVNLAPKSSPIETLPVPVLQINQNRQNEEDHCTGKNSFFIHEGEKTPRPPQQREAGSGTPKVNEQQAGVKQGSVRRECVGPDLLTRTRRARLGEISLASQM